MKLVWYVLLASATIVMASFASPAFAALNGPYNAATQDASTTHLWHLDDTAYGTPEAYPGLDTDITADAMTAGTTYSMVNRFWLDNANRSVAAKATFGHSSYSAAFGSAVGTADHWLDATGHMATGLAFNGVNGDFSPGLYVNYDPAGASDNGPATTYWNQTTGAFTYEAVVQVGFDPTASFGSPAANATNGPYYFSIMGQAEDGTTAGSGKDTTNGIFGFRFGLIPLQSGWHSSFGGTGAEYSDPNKAYLWFKADGASGGPEAAAEIPLTGDQALVKDGWYHLAVTYNGGIGAGSTQFYWTKLGVDDAARTAANALVTTGYAAPLPANPNQTGDFSIGNYNPIATNNKVPWAGIIDEVRVSTTARGADQFLWGATLHPGDFDGDGDVDGADFVAWQTHFPTATGATLAQGDADGDGDVDGADFVVWQTNFPFTPGPGSSPVPEPMSWILVTVGLILGTFTRRKLACR